MMKGKEELISALKRKEKLLIMLAPSFVTDFEYPEIISQLKQIGFDKVTELTFGAKLVNREYHKILENSKGLLIASVCPGIVGTIKQKYPKYEKSIMRVVSPMITSAMVCKKIHKKHKVVFLSPCNFKKIEAEKSKYVDYVVNYTELLEIINKSRIRKSKKRMFFDKFYNDYTKIYPISGGLSKTAHLKGILKPGEERKIDGWKDIEKFLKNPDKKIRFLDVTFCKGGCIGGPFTNHNLSIEQKKQKVLDYFKVAEHEPIPKSREGLIKKAKGLNFRY
jgi:iron only hydrogenase large subunit-like protein